MPTFKNFSLAFLVCNCFVIVPTQVEGRCPRQLRCTCAETKSGLTVNCNGAGLTAVPNNLPNNTVELILSNNPLHQLFNGSFAHVTRLQWLFIDNASLEHIDVTAFRGLKALKVLSLRDNKGLGIYNNSLQPEVFQYIKNLMQLFIQNCATYTHGLQYPTTILSRLIELEDLTLDGISEDQFGPEMLKLHKLSSMDFNGMEGTCNLKHIKADFFSNIPHLKNIYLKYCKIEYIDKDAFRPLYKIFRLDLSFNEGLGFDGFEEGSKGLANSTISELILNKLYPTFGLGIELTISNMRWLKNTKLTRLEVKSNRLETIEWDLLKNIWPRTITYLSLGDNKLTYGLYFFQVRYLINIQRLDVSRMFTSHEIKQLIDDVDTRCYTTCKKEHPGRSSLAMHKSLSQTYAVLSSLYKRTHLEQSSTNESNSPQTIKKNIFPTWPLPPHLTHIDASQMNMKYGIPELRFGDNAVEWLNLNDNTLHSWQGPVHGLKHLKWLGLANNFCTTVSDYFFDYATSLESLLIHQNLLSYSLENDREGNIFKNLRNLRHLNLGYNRIHFLPVNLFRGLQNLSSLDLSNNRLIHLNFSLRNMPHLQHLDLRYNFLIQLSNSIRIDLDQLGDQVAIFVKKNSLMCSCDTFAFVKWLSSTKVRIASKNDIHCSLESLGLESRSLEDIKEIKTLLERACRSYTPFILTGGGGLVLAIIAIFAMTIYRYRWKLRYLYYVSRAKYQGVGEHEDREYLYDAFISYADEDRMFVHELIDKLENEAGLRICIHHRDFIPGRWIPDNIAGAIYNSRKCIFLLSMDFFKSYWCQFEYNMARVEEMHSGRDIVILVNVKYVPARMIPAEIWEQMEVATYITYHPDQRNENFWTNIRTALDH